MPAGVSRHWNPDGEVARWTRADRPRPHKPSWPKGATAGLVLVAAACLAVGAALYQFAGPRQPFDESVAPR